jgi:hypothetical protein
MRKLLFQINLNKVEKKQLFKTDKGVYLSGAIIIRDELDKYGNIAFITQRLEDSDDVIIGNAKPILPKEPQPLTQTEQDDLPF